MPGMMSMRIGLCNNIGRTLFFGAYRQNLTRAPVSGLMRMENNNIVKRHVSVSGKETPIFSLPKSGGSEQRVPPPKSQWERHPLTEKERQIAAALPDEPFLHW